MSTELWRQSALELAANIRDKKVSSREVLEAHLARIEEVNGHVNAVVRVMADDARAMADVADKAIAAGTVHGVFHGVPLSVKENIDVAGLPTTWGIPTFAEAIPTLDAPIVQRMKAAGAIPFVRTNLPDMALRTHTDSSLYGRTKNPWISDRTAGGSSGGEAAALATGMSPIGLGNDIGGSLRNPAHACGISSIKPSVGVVPDAQMFPMEARGLAFQVMNTQGVMARRVADVRAGLNVIAGAHPRDPISVPAHLTDLGAGEKITIAVMPTPPGGSTHPGIASVIRASADALSNMGHNMVEATPPFYEESIQFWKELLMGDIAGQTDLLRMIMGEGGRAFFDFALEINGEISMEQWVATQVGRDDIAREWQLWFEKYPVLLSPTWTQPAYVFDADIADIQGARDTFELMRPVLPVNLLGIPSAVTPGGMADGLPVGVQVIGARFTDLRCLAIAEQIESVLGLSTPIDPRP